MGNLQQKRTNIFNIIPAGFFNYLASNSNQRLYAECLELIYGQYEREISYRIPRNQIRDSLAIYLLENHISLDTDEELEPIKTHGELASAILRKFCSKNVGWLEEENDEATYEKQILMTERGILLAEFLAQLKKPEKEEYAGYIFNIYNTFRNADQWAEHPYVNGIKNIYQNARFLSKSLKRLSTFIRKVIEKMVNEETLESLTENLLEYFDGSFIREYSRLTKQQNIHIYRGYIKAKLDEMKEDTKLLDRLASECMKEEELEETEAREYVEDMILSSRRFLTEDYDRIMKVIKHKINVYLQVAIGRARFLRNREVDERGNIEQTIRYIVEEMEELNWKENLPYEMHSLFTLRTQEFIDTSSLRYPRKQKTVRKAVVAEIEEMTQEDIEKSRKAQEKEAYNPFSKEKMKEYLKCCMGEKSALAVEEMPFDDKNDMLAALSAVVYAEENGFKVIPAEGYLETNRMLLKRFVVRRGDEDEH